MPPKAYVPKKPRLTLAQLASYDDILTDALVDHVYYWTKIRKNRNGYHASRGVREEDVTAILQKSVIVAKDAAGAESQLLTLSGLKKFLDGLKSDREKDDFRQHLRRYINIYLPDCAFEVSTTNRYTLVTHEAAITARKSIKKGEVIKYLSGIQVIMTPEEEDFIQHSRQDFSIVISSRNKQASLFLGPARFANHDCGANAELITRPNQGMAIKARQDIEIGEEITVTYGDSYFGEDNCECLCKTCEDNGQNGWSKAKDSEGAPELSIEGQSAANAAYSLRRRRLASSSSSRHQSETPDVNIRPHVPKRTPRAASRFKNAESPVEKSPSAEADQTPSKRKRESEPSTPIDGTAAKKIKTESPVKVEESPLTASEELMDIQESASFDNAARLSPSPVSSTPESKEASTLRSSPSEGAVSTDVTSIDEETIVVEPRIISPIIQRLRQSKPTSQPGLSDPAIHDDSASNLSDLPSDMDFDDATMTIVAKKRQRRKKRIPRPSTDHDHAPTVRVRGDYVLTPALLGEPASAWINCKICEESFVQKDAYFTRSSCPRCERHSKLYGYVWPKTDREGRHDSEERVLDHRTVHRFVRHDEEKIIRRRGRSETSRPVTREPSASEAAAPEQRKPPVKRGVGRPRNKRVTM